MFLPPALGWESQNTVVGGELLAIAPTVSPELGGECSIHL